MHLNVFVFLEISREYLVILDYFNEEFEEKKFVIKIANINNYTHVSYCSTEAAPQTARVYLNRCCWFLLLNVCLLPLLFSVTAPVLFFIDIGEIETTGGGWGGRGLGFF